MANQWCATLVLFPRSASANSLSASLPTYAYQGESIFSSEAHRRSAQTKWKVAIMCMHTRLYVIALVQFLQFLSATAQPPESFFPYHIGDRWDYRDFNSGQVTSRRLTRDSIGTDGSHNLFYNNEPEPTYRIDTTLNVFWYPQVPSLNYLRYKLPADSCDTWTVRPFPNFRLWAWVARVDSIIVFSRWTFGKVFRFAPGNPCGLGFLEEHWLAAGFGLIYTQREPGEVAYLQGCIIAGDTFGILTSVGAVAGSEPPREFKLKPNYPNPFNPTTTIEFDLPIAAVVRLRVYDMLGRECTILPEEMLAAGMHRIRWDASAMPSGVYFCQLQVYGNVRSIKMVHAK